MPQRGLGSRQRRQRLAPLVPAAVVLVGHPRAARDRRHRQRSGGRHARGAPLRRGGQPVARRSRARTGGRHQRPGGWARRDARVADGHGLGGRRPRVLRLRRGFQQQRIAAAAVVWPALGGARLGARLLRGGIATALRLAFGSVARLLRLRQERAAAAAGTAPVVLLAALIGPLFTVPVAGRRAPRSTFAASLVPLRRAPGRRQHQRHVALVAGVRVVVVHHVVGAQAVPGPVADGGGVIGTLARGLTGALVAAGADGVGGAVGTARRHQARVRDGVQHAHRRAATLPAGAVQVHRRPVVRARHHAAHRQRAHHLPPRLGGQLQAVHVVEEHAAVPADAAADVDDRPRLRVAEEEAVVAAAHERGLAVRDEPLAHRAGLEAELVHLHGGASVQGLGLPTQKVEGVLRGDHHQLAAVKLHGQRLKAVAALREPLLADHLRALPLLGAVRP
mmetsp:Transcript_29781/g.76976  ORF Transcript_29781/g.76976 Transcript_29781/m.76976 type:complete len:449 (+) Transcript_29781:588-1934(+)